MYLREGGSIPIIADLKNVTNLDSLMLGFVTPNDNIHAPNESFNLDLMGKAIDATERILLSIADFNNWFYINLEYSPSHI